MREALWDGTHQGSLSLFVKFNVKSVAVAGSTQEAACLSFRIQISSGRQLAMPAQVCALTVTGVCWTSLTYSFNLDFCC